MPAMRGNMPPSDKDYQRAFFKLVMNKTNRSIDDISTDLLIHKNTLKKWVSAEQAAPAIAYSAMGMYLKLFSLNDGFNFNQGMPSYKNIVIENANEEMKKDSFKIFKEKAISILESVLDDDIKDLELYFLYSCIHDKSKVDEICIFVRNSIQTNKEKSKKGVFGNSPTKVTRTLLISCYISQYPDEAIQSIKLAYTKGLIDKNAMSFSVNKRLELINYKYNLFITDLKWSLTNRKDENLSHLLSKFDYNSDQFSPSEFIGLFEKIKNLYIEKNGTDIIDSTRALNLSLNTIHNFDFL